MNFRDPIDLTCLAAMCVLAAVGAWPPAIILFGVIVANIVDRGMVR